MNRLEYPVLLSPAEEGGFVVTCRDLPELITQGDDKQHALAEAADAMDEVFAACIVAGLQFPVPSKARRNELWVSPPVETVAKAALCVAMREAGIARCSWPGNWGWTKRKSAACWTRTMGQSFRALPRPSACWASGW